jgi:hypothetical protein
MDGTTSPKLTQAGVVVGTPAYMAPEQVLSQPVDFRTDLFALGVLIYELTAGVNPFVTKTVSGTFARIVEAEPSVLSEVRPQVPQELERIVARCLRKDPADRYSSTQDLVTDFDRLESEFADLRPRSNDRGDLTPAKMPGVWRVAWWRTHQVVVVGLYVIAAALGWNVKEWVEVPVTVSVFIGLGAGAAIGGVLRGHLLFTQYFNWPNLAVVLMGSALVVDAIMLIRWPLTAVLTMACGIVIALCSLVLEPATTKAALRDR